MEKLIIIVIIIFSVTIGLNAQIPVQGKVTGSTGDALSGVLVRDVTNPINNRTTNQSGKYTMNIMPNASLEFSLLGMETLVEPVNGRNNVNVTMIIGEGRDAIAGMEDFIEEGQAELLPDPNPGIPAQPNRQQSMLVGDDDMQMLLADLDRPPNAVWRTSNGGYSATFRNVIRNNYVHKQAEISNYFAACATLAGTYDQVLITKMDIAKAIGYWSQFKQSYTLTDPSIFDFFKFKTSNFPLKKETAGKSLLHILDKLGPVILAQPGNDLALVITEVTCDQSWDCTVWAIDYSPENFYMSPQNSKGTLVPEGSTKLPYKTLRVGNGLEIPLRTVQLYQVFDTAYASKRSDGTIDLLLASDRNLTAVARLGN